jgi:hypothetical protein
MSNSDLTIRVPVAAPAPKVFAALTDWARQSEWILATKVWPVGPQRRGVGDRLEAFTGLRTRFGNIGFLDTMVVTEWLEGRSVTVSHTGKIVRGGGTFAVTPRSQQTCEVSWTENLSIPGGAVGRWLFRLGSPVSRWAVGFSLRRFAHQVEADPADSTVSA